MCISRNLSISSKCFNLLSKDVYHIHTPYYYFNVYKTCNDIMGKDHTWMTNAYVITLSRGPATKHMSDYILFLNSIIFRCLQVNWTRLRLATWLLGMLAPCSAVDGGRWGFKSHGALVRCSKGVLLLQQLLSNLPYLLFYNMKINKVQPHPLECKLSASTQRCVTSMIILHLEMVQVVW